MTIGEKIKSLRKAKGKSQEDLALDLGVSRQTINKWETNKVQPNTDNLMILCSILEVSSDYFLVSETREFDIEIAVSTDSAQNKRKILKVCAIVVGVSLLISICFNIIFGFVVFSPNTGDVVVGTDSIEIATFLSSLIFCILSLGAEIVLLISIWKKHIKKRKVNNK